MRPKWEEFVGHEEVKNYENGIAGGCRHVLEDVRLTKEFLESLFGFLDVFF